MQMWVSMFFFFFVRQQNKGGPTYTHVLDTLRSMLTMAHGNTEGRCGWVSQEWICAEMSSRWIGGNERVVELIPPLPRRPKLSLLFSGIRCAAHGISPTSSSLVPLLSELRFSIPSSSSCICRTLRKTLKTAVISFTLSRACINKSPQTRLPARLGPVKTHLFCSCSHKGCSWTN